MRIHTFSGTASQESPAAFEQRTYIEDSGWNKTTRFAGILASLIAHYPNFGFLDMAYLAWLNDLDNWEFTTSNKDKQPLNRTTLLLPKEFPMPSGWYTKYFAPWSAGSLEVDLPEAPQIITQSNYVS